MVARRRPSGAAASTGFSACSGFSPRMPTSRTKRRMRKMRRDAAFSDFIAKGECTGPRETKKAAPFRGRPFSKRLMAGIRGYKFDAALGDRNGQSEGREHREGSFHTGG